MKKQEGTVMMSFAMPHSLLRKIKLVALNEDLNISILLPKMVRDWLGQYDADKNQKEMSNMNP